jgi:hypothetical protein
MPDSLQTDLDRSYLDPEVRAAALRVLTRTGNTDVAEILGLAAPTAPEGGVLVDGRVHCAACRYPMPRSGQCRRMRQCRVGAADRELL